MKNKKFIIAIWIAGLIVTGAALVKEWRSYNWIYCCRENWAYFAEGGDVKSADLFLIASTVDEKDENNMSLDDAENRQKFLATLKKERGIYGENTRIYAPYYQQGALKLYDISEDEREEYLKIAYKDIKNAFLYYLKHENRGRPFILAGFSQGADMCLRLLKDFFANEKLSKKLIAVYAIGWPCYYELTDKYSFIKPAVRSDDIGVVVNFECEAPEIKGTVLYPADKKSHAINPLSWRVDEAEADKSLNLGACFVNYDGEIKSEIKNFCGAYLDLERGVVKIPDLNKDEYRARVPFLPDGAYHVYDYMFFYRNLQENVNVRIDAYLKNFKDLKD